MLRLLGRPAVHSHSSALTQLSHHASSSLRTDSLTTCARIIASHRCAQHLHLPHAASAPLSTLAATNPKPAAHTHSASSQSPRPQRATQVPPSSHSHSNGATAVGITSELTPIATVPPRPYNSHHGEIAWEFAQFAQTNAYEALFTHLAETERAKLREAELKLAAERAVAREKALEEGREPEVYEDELPLEQLSKKARRRVTSRLTSSSSAMAILASIPRSTYISAFQSFVSVGSLDGMDYIIRRMEQLEMKLDQDLAERWVEGIIMAILNVRIKAVKTQAREVRAKEIKQATGIIDGMIADANATKLNPSTAAVSSLSAPSNSLSSAPSTSAASSAPASLSHVFKLVRKSGNDTDPIRTLSSQLTASDARSVIVQIDALLASGLMDAELSHMLHSSTSDFNETNPKKWLERTRNALESVLNQHTNQTAAATTTASSSDSSAPIATTSSSSSPATSGTHSIGLPLTNIAREQIDHVYDMCTRHSVKPLFRLVRASFEAYAADADVHGGIALIARLFKMRVFVNGFTYAMFIQALAKHLHQQGAAAAQSCMFVFLHMERAKFEPQSETFNALIHAFSLIGDYQTAYKLMQDMIGLKMEPDSTTYAGIIEACCRAGKLHLAEEMFEYIKKNGEKMKSQMKQGQKSVIGEQNGKMLQTNNQSSASSQPQLKPSAFSIGAKPYFVLINEYLRLDQLPKAITLLNSMVDENIQPELRTYHALFRACNAEQRHVEVRQLWSQMQSMRVVPLVTTYNFYFPALGSMSEVRSVYRDMTHPSPSALHPPLTPDSYTFNALSRIAARSGDLSAISWILTEMHRYNILPTPSFLRTLSRIFHSHQKESNASLLLLTSQKLGVQALTSEFLQRLCQGSEQDLKQDWERLRNATTPTSDEQPSGQH